MFSIAIPELLILLAIAALLLGPGSIGKGIRRLRQGSRGESRTRARQETIKDKKQ